MIGDMLSRCRALMVKWFNQASRSEHHQIMLGFRSPKAPIPGFDQAREMRSRCSMLEFQFSIQAFAFRLEPHDATILDECLARAVEIVEQTELINAAGGLRWLPDLPMTGTTAVAMFLKDVSVPGASF